MAQTDCPCTPECPKRSAICHAQCVTYHEWVAALRAKKHNAWAARSGQRDAAQRHNDMYAARQRREHMNGRRKV